MGKKQTVDALVEGGKASAGPPIGSSLGPLKVNVGQIVADINDKTKDFKGMKVPVKIIVDAETKEFTIEIGTPPASQLLMKEINLDKGSGEPNVTKAGVISIEQVFKVARMKSSSLLVNNMRSAVKTIVGSCQSMGLLIDGKEPKEVLKEIDEGKHDSIFSSGKTEPDEAKKKMLSDVARDLENKKKQRQKEKEAAKAAAEAEAAAKAAAAPSPGTAPTAGAPATSGTAPAPGAKPAAAPAKKEPAKK